MISPKVFLAVADPVVGDTQDAALAGMAGLGNNKVKE